MAALSGLHVVFSFAGAPGWGREMLLVGGKPVSSQTLATAGTTAISAPKDTGALGDLASGIRAPVVSLIASGSGWASIGPSPNAAADPRRRIVGGTEYDFGCDPSDKVDWLPDP